MSNVIARPEPKVLTALVYQVSAVSCQGSGQGKRVGQSIARVIQCIGLS